ncbi:MAG: DUF1365 domain-containing protein [Thermoleophilaceae bacterium]|nr:DUF1365 domain-containing protein [Thermoleophilaceae bacterium]
MSASCVYEGWVRHRRFAPVEHDFRYPLFLVYLDLDELPEVFDGALAWSARRPALARFRRSDFMGGGEGRPLRETVLDLVEERTGRRPGGPVRLLTQLRQYGFSFNPVSFYYCFDPRGQRVETVAAEVTNTPWRERHTYVLERAPTAEGSVLVDRIGKEFHVSPFLGMGGDYEWRVSEPGEALQVQIESSESASRVFDATLSLERRELEPKLLRRLLVRYPAATLAVVARIYLQALRLKLKGVRHFPHPERAR